MKFNRGMIFSGLAMGGALVSVFLASRAGVKAEKNKEELMQRCAEEGREPKKSEKFKACAKPFIFTAVGLAFTEGCIVAANGAYLKEIGVATALAASATNKLKTYRQAAVEVVGEEKEREIINRAAEIELQKSSLDIEETVHRFHANFVGEDLYFTARTEEVMNGLMELNHILNVAYDRWSGYSLNMNKDEKELIRVPGTPVVADFYDILGIKEGVNPKTIAGGWNESLLSIDWDSYWLPFKLVKKFDSRGEYIDILCHVDPYEDVEATIKEYEVRGLL